MKKCPSCHAVAYDPVLEYCEECGWEPEDDEEAELEEESDLERDRR